MNMKHVMFYKANGQILGEVIDFGFDKVEYVPVYKVRVGTGDIDVKMNAANKNIYDVDLIKNGKAPKINKILDSIKGLFN